MKNSFGENFTIDNNEAVLNIENTATFLGISTATVRNWVKCGYLQSIREDARYLFHKKEVENVKSKIKNGDIEKLNKRANKAKADKTFIPEEYLQDGASLSELNSIVDFIKTNDVGLLPALLLVALNILKKEKILLKADIRQRDVLGFLYQSLLHEGEKSQNGSYYTPANIVSEIIGGYVKKDSKVLDPCCGTGQFCTDPHM